MDIYRYGRKSAQLMLIGGLGVALTGAATPAAGTSPDIGPAVAPAAGTTSETARTGGSEADLAAFERIRREQEGAWARGDAAAYAAKYAPEADLINITGEHLHGRNLIATRMKNYLGTSSRRPASSSWRRRSASSRPSWR